MIDTAELVHRYNLLNESLGRQEWAYVKGDKIMLVKHYEGAKLLSPAEFESEFQGLQGRKK